MKLLVNISSIGARPTGLGIYALRCAAAVSKALDSEVIAADGVSGFDNVVLRAPASCALGAGRSAAIRRWAWSKRQPHLGGRLCYSPTHHVFGRTRDQILTIHDLIALRFPRQHPTQHLYFRYGLPAELARTRALFTVSETTRQDIHEHYRYPLDRIWVVPNGVDRSVFHPAAASCERERFLLVVGANLPHKNVEELIDNATCWRDDYELVVVSCRGAQRRKLETALDAARLRERVRFIEYAPQSELVSLYRRCAAFVYPSRWEGFGIPPLEALACGARVIVSDIPAHREVLGTSALFVRLGQRADWARAFAELRRGGSAVETRPLERFSWERSGALLVQHLLALEPRLVSRLAESSTIQTPAH